MRILCSEGKIAGAKQVGRTWLIPSDANKPIDERVTRYYSCFNSFYDTGNSQEMTSLIGEYVEEMLDKYLEILK